MFNRLRTSIVMSSSFSRTSQTISPLYASACDKTFSSLLGQDSNIQSIHLFSFYLKIHTIYHFSASFPNFSLQNPQYFVDSLVPPLFSCLHPKETPTKLGISLGDRSNELQISPFFPNYCNPLEFFSLPDSELWRRRMEPMYASKRRQRNFKRYWFYSTKDTINLCTAFTRTLGKEVRWNWNGACRGSRMSCREESREGASLREK